MQLAILALVNMSGPIVDYSQSLTFTTDSRLLSNVSHVKGELSRRLDKWWVGNNLSLWLV